LDAREPFAVAVLISQRARLPPFGIRSESTALTGEGLRVIGPIWDIKPTSTVPTGARVL